MGVRVYITKRSLEHPTFSVGVIIKHWKYICDSAAKILIPCQPTFLFFSF